MPSMYQLPPDAHLLALDARRPASTRDILRNAGHQALGDAYADACAQYDRTSATLMKRQLGAEDADETSFAQLLQTHPGLKDAAQRKSKLWTEIEAIKRAAVARLNR